MRTDSRIKAANCRACREPIHHALNSLGRRIAVDAFPDSDGDLRLVFRRGDVPPDAVYTPKPQKANYLPSEPWYLEHLCPQAVKP